MNDILKQWSEKLNGREYRSELTRDEETELKQQGIVAVFGFSDDLCEFRGAADDEMDCFDGGIIFIKPNGDVLYSVKNTDTYKTIHAVWNENRIPWTYKTDIPHETFDIMEDGEIYCKGILFRLADCAPKLTNYERIKAMSIEEMALVLTDEVPYENCYDCNKSCNYGLGLDRYCANKVYQWLESEVDEK